MALSQETRGGRAAAFVAVTLVGLVFAVQGTVPAAAKEGPRLTKAGIACAKDAGGQACLLFVRARGAGEVEYRFKQRQRFRPAAHWDRDIYGARQWYRNPVRKGCLTVMARAEGKRGIDRGRLRLCRVGHAPATSPYETAWTYADYKRF